MKFKLVSSDARKVSINMELINIYTSRYLPGTSFDLEITRRQAKKSTPMRKYYFGFVLPPLMLKVGYSVDETKEFHKQLKIRHFIDHPDFLDAEGKAIIKQDEWGIWQNVPHVFRDESTLNISVKKIFVDGVRKIAANEGVYTPDPGE